MARWVKNYLNSPYKFIIYLPAMRYLVLGVIRFPSCAYTLIPKTYKSAKSSPDVDLLHLYSWAAMGGGFYDVFRANVECWVFGNVPRSKVGFFEGYGARFMFGVPIFS